jgi:hypothetical protein
MEPNSQPPQPPNTPAPEQPASPSESKPEQTVQPADTTPQTLQPPQQPNQPKKNHTSLFIIAGISVLLIGTMLVYIMGSASKKTAQTQQVPVQVSQQTTATPIAAPSQSAQDEVNSVNVTVDNSDIKDVEKDVNSL